MRSSLCSFTIIRLASLPLLACCQGEDNVIDVHHSIPTMATNITRRSNFCYAIADVYKDRAVEMKDILRGKTVAIGVFDYQLDRESGGLNNDSMSVKLMDELARRAGFEWRNSYGVIESPSDSNNYTFDSLLEWGTSVYDVMLEYFVRTLERLQSGIEYVDPCYDASFIMVMKKQKNYNNWDLFFKPFSWELWLLLFVTVILSGIFYFMIDYLDSRRKSENMEATLSGNLFSAAYAFTGHALYHPRTMSTRLVAWSLCFMYLVLISIYTANMANLLIMKGSNSKTIQTIDDAAKKDLTFCAWKYTATDTYLKENYKSLKIHSCTSDSKCLEFLIDGSCDVYLTFASAWEIMRRNVRFNEDCSLEWVGRVVEERTGSYTTKRDYELCSPFFTDVLSSHIIDLEVDGTLNDMWKAHYDESGTKECDENNYEVEDESEITLNIEQVGALFVLHFVTVFFSLVLSVVRIYQMPKEKRKRISDELRNVRHPGQLKKAAELGNMYSSTARNGKTRFTMFLENSRWTKRNSEVRSGRRVVYFPDESQSSLPLPKSIYRGRKNSIDSLNDSESKIEIRDYDDDDYDEVEENKCVSFGENCKASDDDDDNDEVKVCRRVSFDERCKPPTPDEALSKQDMIKYLDLIKDFLKDDPNKLGKED